MVISFTALQLVLIILKTTISYNISLHRDTKAAIYRYTQIVHRCTSNACYEVIAYNILMAKIFTIKLTDWINLNPLTRISRYNGFLNIALKTHEIN